QKAVLFLGNPLYALPVVLATLLVSAGSGSRVLAHSGWDVRRVTGPVALGFLALLAVLVGGGATPFPRSLSRPGSRGRGRTRRVGVTVVVLAPLGVLMGMFFPSGLQSVGEEAADFVPWAWGINGCLSVYGSVVAILAAMVYGFTATLALGAVAYAGAFLAAR